MIIIKWYSPNPLSVVENEVLNLLWDFEISNGMPYLDQTTRLSNSQQKQRTNRSVDFGVQADLEVKLTEVEKRENYIDLARESVGYVMKKTKIKLWKLAQKESDHNWVGNVIDWQNMKIWPYYQMTRGAYDRFPDFFRRCN